MTSDQADAWTEAAMRVQAMTEQYGPGLALASCAVTGWWTCRWICRRTFQAYDWLCERRELRTTPAAYDNQAPQDDDLLATCLDIARLHTADPINWRNAERHLRQKGDETP